MPATIFKGSKVKTLKSTLTVNDNIDIITGDSDDPRLVAKDAPIGSEYRRSGTSQVFRKLDNGSTTNWVLENSGPSVGVQLRGGGTREWDAGTGQFTFTSDITFVVPGLSDSDNTIPTSESPVSIPAGQCAYTTLNTATGGPNLTVSVDFPQNVPDGAVTFLYRDGSTLRYSNIADTYSELISLTRSNSEFRINTPSGHGSTGTEVRTFSNLVQSATFVNYTSDSTNGDTFEITKNGLYRIEYVDRRAGGSTCLLGLSHNASSTTTGVTVLAEDERLAFEQVGVTGTICSAQATLWLEAGDIIRAHNQTAAGKPDSTETFSNFRIVQLIDGSVRGNIVADATKVIGDLNDVDMTTTPPVAGDELYFNGTIWVPRTKAQVGAFQGAAFNLTNSGVDTDITAIFNSENWDDGGDFNTGTGVFTAPRTGYYLCSYYVTMAVSPGTASGFTFTIKLAGGGFTYSDREIYVPAFAQSMTAKIVTPVKLAAGNTLQLFAAQNGAANYGLATGFANTRLTIAEQ